MNTAIKIILLIVAILLAFGGTMFFYNTIVSPPGKLEFNNQFFESAKQDIDKIESVNTDYALDSSYYAITHELDFQLSNSLLTEQERDELMESFATHYVPVFVSSCDSKFSASVWHEYDLGKMKNRVRELQNLKTTEAKTIIEGEANESLNRVNEVVANYFQAKNAASVTGYYGLQTARQRIETARKFASMSPINNCTWLRDKLNSLPSRLESEHYKFLRAKVDKLNDYDCSQEMYESRAIKVSDEIEIYKKNAREIYGTISSTDFLVQLAGEYYSNSPFN